MNINKQINNIINNYYSDKIFNNSFNILDIKKEILNKLILDDKELFNNITNDKLINIYNMIDIEIFNNKKNNFTKEYDLSVNTKHEELNDVYYKLQKHFNIEDIIDYNDIKKRDEFISYLIDYSIDNSDKELQRLLYSYIKSENEIMQRQIEEEKIIKEYENNLYDLKSRNNLSETDIQNYFKCVREAILSYDEKNLGKDYNFNSVEINNSIHAGLELDLSVTKGQLPHLLGLANPSYDLDNSDKSIYISLYKKYLKERNIEHSDDNYLLYVYLYLEKDLIEYLKTNEKDKKKIKKTIIKSFDKSINFISIYEYKKIPEIILDYDVRKTYSVTVDNSTTSALYLPNEQTFPEDYSKDLITKAMQSNIPLNCRSKIKELINSGYNFTKQDKEFVDIIKKQFENADEVYVSLKDGKIETNYIEYQDNIYMFNSNKFWVQLESNIYVASYNSEKCNKKMKELDNYTNDAFLCMCASLKKDLNIKNVNSEITLNKNLHSFNNMKRNHLINIDYIIYTICKMNEEEMEELLSNKDIVYDKENLEDYNILKKYVDDAFDESLSSQINNSFGITNNISCNSKYSLIEEPPLLRMIPRITRNLLVKNNKEELLKKDVRIIGFATTRKENEKVAADYFSDQDISKIPASLLQKLYQTKGKFKEKFAKTFMAKTLLQLKYDLQVNGWAYKLDSISTITTNKNKIYYNCKKYIDNEKVMEKINYFLKNYKLNLDESNDYSRGK